MVRPHHRMRLARVGPGRADAPSPPLTLPLVGSAALAGASLALPSTVTYDPFAWAGWARELVHLQLDTRTGPAWKALPVLFDLPFAPFGHDVLWAWLWLARAGGLLSVAMAYRLARRAAGPVAGTIAAAGVVTSTSWLFYLMATGLSEPLLAGLALLALERHLDGHPAQASALLYACVLLRPEAGLFWLAYSLWRGGRSPRSRVWTVVGLALLPVVWLGPDYLGSGDWLRSARRAAIPSEGGPLLTGHPGLAVLQSAARAVILPVLVGAGMALVLAARSWWRRRTGAPGSADARALAPAPSRRAAGLGSGPGVDRVERLTLVYAGVAASTLLLEAALTQAQRSAGDQRYLIVGYTMACVVAGIGWVWGVEALTAWLRRRRREGAESHRLACIGTRVTAAALVVPFVVAPFLDLPAQIGGMDYQVHKDGQIQAIAAHFGRTRILGCGLVMADTYQGAALAWYLDVPISRITVIPPPPGGVAPGQARGTLWRTSNLGDGPVIPSAPADPAFRILAQTSQWQVLGTCAFGPSSLFTDSLPPMPLKNRSDERD
jgi:hypothetical protein